jgi:hypothetical protein
MRYMMFIKHTEDYRQETVPASLYQAMGEFVTEAMKNGNVIDTAGLQPSSAGLRVKLKGGKISVVDGPFTETKELVAGYWIWQVQSMEEAVEWVRRCPDPMPGEESEIEIRPIYELEEFGNGITPEQRAKEEMMRAELARQRRS